MHPPEEGPLPLRASTPPLLHAKVHAPARRRALVPRPRLAARLAGPSAPPLTLVSAAPGFGKTTLMAQWLGDRPGTAWLTLDPRDNDPTLFWAYVIAALQVVEPGLGDGARALLDSPRPPADAVVTLLLNDLAALPRDVVLVLDDYHVIGSPEIHQAMALMVDHLPPRVRLVVAGRADPPLPLAGLRARGGLAEVRAADLRFTPEEAAAYLNEAMGLHLGAADVDALGARTEGWIAALQLAALSMQGRDDVSGFIAGFAGDDRFVLDYLAGEVLERQRPEVRDFLLQTSILSRLTGPLCDAVTGREGGRATLERLERANMFLVPLDDRRAWYRYHHLFADVLRARLMDERPHDVAGLHRRASAWHEGAGDLPEAIRHAMEARDFPRAADLIERSGPHMRRTRQEVTLRRWCEALPGDLLPDRPVLAIGLVGALMASGRFDGVQPLLEMVERRLDATASGAGGMVVADRDALASLPAQVAVYRAALALVGGDPAGTIAHAGRALDAFGPGEHLGRGSAAALIGLAHWAAGDLGAAEGRYAQAMASLERAGHLSDVLGCSLALSDIRAAQGRLGAAADALEDALRLAGASGTVRGTADLHVGLGEIGLARDDQDGAARHLEASAGIGVAGALPQHAYRSRVAAARLREARGDLAGALEALAEAEPLYDTDFSPPVRPVAAVAARVRLRMGQAAEVLRWARERGLDAGDELAYVREYEHVTLARALLQARPDEGRALLARLLAAAEAGGRQGTVIELLALQALAHQRHGDQRAALAALDRALALAAPEGGVRVFLDEGAPMADLLRTAALRGGSRSEARRVLGHATPAAPGPPRPAAGPAEELSDRELEVLRLLRSDLSGPDIARELVVSLNTLRTHTKRIYAKLGVNSRRAAVSRAGELGLR